MPTFTPRKSGLLLDQAKKCVNRALRAHQQPKRLKKAPKPLKNQPKRVSKCHQVKKIFTALKANALPTQKIYELKWERQETPPFPPANAIATAK